MHLFNPENDLALANFKANYTPPASAVRMARELAVFPIWYAGEEMTNGTRPIVIAEGEDNRSFVDKMKEIFPLQASLVPFSGIALYPDEQIIPWDGTPRWYAGYGLTARARASFLPRRDGKTAWIL